MNKKKILKIIVPLFILIIIGGIWIVKNTEKDEISYQALSQDFKQLEANEDFVLEASSINLDKLREYNMPIIIDFGADSCIPCKEMAPVLKKLNSELQGNAIIKFVDVWKFKDGANGFPIQVIPTQVLYNSDGKPYVPTKPLSTDFIMYKDRGTEEHIFTVHQGGLTEEEIREILSDMEKIK